MAKRIKNVKQLRAKPKKKVKAKPMRVTPRKRQEAGISGMTIPELMGANRGDGYGGPLVGANRKRDK